MEKQAKVKGLMDNSKDHTFESANRVYDEKYSCPTLQTCTGGVLNRKLLSVMAMRGRENGQTFEIRYDGICNTITTVQKDNMYVAKVYRDKTGN